ncbi:MAG: DoxX family membrane protein [Actinomycetota bacterium]|nr:DoxX family membrane protein [Actinomycetota bacterium]
MAEDREEPGRRASRLTLAAFMIGAGALHFAIPSSYARIVPRVAGTDDARALVLVSGAAEILVGVLLVIPRTTRLGAALTAALLVAVFPANVQMALDGGIPGEGFPLGAPVVAWVRLPLQVPLVWWALVHARRP